MTTRLATILVIALLPVVCPAPTSARTVKYAVVLGNNLGSNPDDSLRFAEEDARKFHRVLIELGGFAEDDAVLLLGADADQTWRALRRVEARIAAQRKEGILNEGDRTMLIFYYSGHAEGDALELGGTVLRLAGLLDFLKSSPVDLRLAILDSCLSGKLVSMKGGRRGPTFDIRIDDELSSEGYAIITSSADNELSQESVELRGAFFTHYLVSALRGTGDQSGDGKVTLGEAYHYTYNRTLARTSVTIGGSQHPMYEYKIEGQGEVVLTEPGIVNSYLGVTVAEGGRLLILDERRESIVAEADLRPAQKGVLAVAAGQYSVYLLTEDNAVRAAQAIVTQAGRAELTDSDFKSIQLTEAVAKGGLFAGSNGKSEPLRGSRVSGERELPVIETAIRAPPPGDPAVHRIGVAGLWRKWPFEAFSGGFGAAVSYRADVGKGPEFGVLLGWSGSESPNTQRYDELRGLLGLGYALRLAGLVLRGSVNAGYEHIFQKSDVDGTLGHASGLDFVGLIGAEIPLGITPFFISGEVGAGVRLLQMKDDGWVLRSDLQASLGLGLRLGKSATE